MAQIPKKHISVSKLSLICLVFFCLFFVSLPFSARAGFDQKLSDLSQSLSASIFNFSESLSSQLTQISKAGSLFLSQFKDKVFSPFQNLPQYFQITAEKEGQKTEEGGNKEAEELNNQLEETSYKLAVQNKEISSAEKTLQAKKTTKETVTKKVTEITRITEVVQSADLTRINQNIDSLSQDITDLASQISSRIDYATPSYAPVYVPSFGLQVSGHSLLSTINVTGSGALGGSLSVKDNVAFGNETDQHTTFEVYSTATFNEAAAFNRGMRASSLVTSGNLTVSGNGTISGTLSAATTTITGDFTVQDSDSAAHLYVDNDTGYVGIGTTTPQFKLSIDDDGGILAVGTYSSGATLTTSGAGTRLIWYPKKAAFRAGYVGDKGGTEWDDSNIGHYSTAMGNSTIASGSYSTALGYSTTASKSYSTALGYSTTASGDSSTAMGSHTTASGLISTAMGSETTASGNYSTALGLDTTASGLFSTAMGSFSTASGSFSIALGFNTTGSGDYSTAIGYNTIGSGNYSTAMGYYTTGSGNYSTAMGYYTSGSGDYSTVMGSKISTQGNYSFGIGLDNTERTITQANTMAIVGGNVGIGTTTPYSRLSVWGDGTNPIFEAVDNASSTKMVILNSGNIGIGTTTPWALLSVAGSAGGTSNVFVISTSTAAYATSTAFIVDSDGRVGIGTTTPWQGMELAITGDILVTGDVYKSDSAYDNPDYVFEPDYDLMTLDELREYIAVEKHLPNMSLPTGPINISEQVRKQLEKIEENTLYILELEQRTSQLTVIQDESGQLIEIDSLGNLRDRLTDLGLSVDEQGVLTVDKIKARVIEAETIETKTGVTIYDRKTNQPYCLYIEDGQTKTSSGVCLIDNVQELTEADPELNLVEEDDFVELTPEEQLVPLTPEEEVVLEEEPAEPVEEPLVEEPEEPLIPVVEEEPAELTDQTIIE